MANEFPRKSLPSTSADPLSLVRHIGESDPHPGRYIKIDDNILDLEHPTLYSTCEEFRKIPSWHTVLGYSPRLVIYTGAEAQDSATGVTYQTLHPYVYEGNTIVVGDREYPVWVDKITYLSESISAELKALLYQHATDTGSDISNVHPTLARKEHTHHYTTIENFGEGVYEVSKGIYAYAVSNETELNNRRIDGALIIYTGEECEYDVGKFVERGHLYRYDSPNNLWIDVTASNEGYSRREINELIEKHNGAVLSAQTPWKHDSLAPLHHQHISADISDLEACITVIVDDHISGVIDEHNYDARAHATAFDAKANASDFNAHANNQIIHVTSNDRTVWNSKATSSDIAAGINTHNLNLAAHPNGFNHNVTITGGTSPSFIVKNSALTNVDRPTTTTTLGKFDVLCNNTTGAQTSDFTLGVDVSTFGINSYLRVSNKVAQANDKTNEFELCLSALDDGTAKLYTNAIVVSITNSDVNHDYRPDKTYDVSKFIFLPDPEHSTVENMPPSGRYYRGIEEQHYTIGGVVYVYYNWKSEIPNAEFGTIWTTTKTPETGDNCYQYSQYPATMTYVGKVGGKVVSEGIDYDVGSINFRPSSSNIDISIVGCKIIYRNDVVTTESVGSYGVSSYMYVYNEVAKNYLVTHADASKDYLYDLQLIVFDNGVGQLRTKAELYDVTANTQASTVNDNHIATCAFVKNVVGSTGVTALVYGGSEHTGKINIGSGLDVSVSGGTTTLSATGGGGSAGTISLTIGNATKTGSTLSFSLTDIGAASASHTHSGYASTTHSHAQGDISGLSTALSGKANSTHSHTITIGNATKSGHNLSFTLAEIGINPSESVSAHDASTHSHTNGFSHDVQIAHAYGDPDFSIINERYEYTYRSSVIRIGDFKIFFNKTNSGSTTVEHPVAYFGADTCTAAEKDGLNAYMHVINESVGTKGIAGEVRVHAHDDGTVAVRAMGLNRSDNSNFRVTCTTDDDIVTKYYLDNFFPALGAVGSIIPYSGYQVFPAHKVTSDGVTYNRKFVIMFGCYLMPKDTAYTPFIYLPTNLSMVFAVHANICPYAYDTDLGANYYPANAAPIQNPITKKWTAIQLYTSWGGGCNIFWSLFGAIDELA